MGKKGRTRGPAGLVLYKVSSGMAAPSSNGRNPEREKKEKRWELLLVLEGTVGTRPAARQIHSRLSHQCRKPPHDGVSPTSSMVIEMCMYAE